MKQLYPILFILLNLLIQENGLYGQVQLSQSNLPIILVNTNGQDIVDEPKITADMKIIYNGASKENKITDTIFHYNNKIGIEFRGSSSQGFPKKPYGFETRNEKEESLEVGLLGMPKESDWTFNASYNDKTLMRDGLTYILAGTFMDYAPRVRYSELMINGKYEGVYLLIEKIKRGKNRVNIAKMKDTDNSGDALTGGYIIKIDKESGSNSGEGWYSKYRPYTGAWQSTFFQYDYPKAKNITDPQKSYIANYINNVETVLKSKTFDDPINGYRKYIDTKSLQDYIIVNELTKNPDAYRLSTFFYKERDSEGGKIKFGPVWDYSIGLGNVDYCTQSNPEDLVIEEFNKVCGGDYWVVHFWWERFLADSVFYNDLKLRWHELRQNQLSEETILNTVDSLATLINTAQDRNFKRWPILGKYIWPNYFVGNTYAEEVDYLKDWLVKRLAWLDEKWKIETVHTIQTIGSNLSLYPNPVSGMAYIRDITDNVTLQPLQVENIQGKVINLPIHQNGQNELVYDFNTAIPGVYFIKIIANGMVKTCKIIKN